MSVPFQLFFIPLCLFLKPFPLLYNLNEKMFLAESLHFRWEDVELSSPASSFFSHNVSCPLLVSNQKAHHTILGTSFSKCLLSSRCFLLKVSPLLSMALPSSHWFLLKVRSLLSLALILLSSHCFLQKVSPLLSLEVCTSFSKCLLSSQCFLLKVSPCYPWKLALYSQNFSCPLSVSS